MTTTPLRTIPARVTEIKITDAPRSTLGVDGYGCTGTEIMLRYRHTNGRRYWHRVYALCYGNGASLTIELEGEMIFLDIETQHRVDRAVNAA